MESPKKATSFIDAETPITKKEKNVLRRHSDDQASRDNIRRQAKALLSLEQSGELYRQCLMLNTMYGPMFKEVLYSHKSRYAI